MNNTKCITGIRLILGMAPSGINNCLHTSRHALIERLEVGWRDLPPDLEGDSFQTRGRRCALSTLQLLHLGPQRLNRIEIRTVSRPTRKELYAVLLVPLLRRNGAVRRGAIFHQRERSTSAPEKVDDVRFLQNVLVARRIDCSFNEDQLALPRRRNGPEDHDFDGVFGRSRAAFRKKGFSRTTSDELQPAVFPNLNPRFIREGDF